jgi:hypothetical protein
VASGIPGERLLGGERPCDGIEAWSAEDGVSLGGRLPEPGTEKDPSARGERELAGLVRVAIARRKHQQHLQSRARTVTTCQRK